MNRVLESLRKFFGVDVEQVLFIVLLQSANDVDSAPAMAQGNISSIYSI